MSLDEQFRRAVRSLLSHLPAIRDGNPEAIHDARVATRRLRSMIPLLASVIPGDEWESARVTLKQAARALGKARDIDVALALAAELETRAPLFAPVLAALRGELLPEQLAARRKLIRRLESLSLRPLRELPGRDGGILRWSRIADVGRVLPPALAEQAQQVRRAVDHASGVYFTGRTHAARIAIKELRYLLELSDDCKARRKGLKLLKTSQEALGQIHDREGLVDRLRRMEPPPRDPAAALIGVLEAEARTLYEKYANTREDVVSLCDAIHAWATASRASWLRSRMLGLGAAALPSAVLFLARRPENRTASLDRQAPSRGSDSAARPGGAKESPGKERPATLEPLGATSSSADRSAG